MKTGEIETKEGRYCATCYHHEKECNCEESPLDLLARSSAGWTASLEIGGHDPVVRVLSDDEFDAQVDKRSSAHKHYSGDNLGIIDYSRMKVCTLKFSDGADEILIRESLLPLNKP